MQRTYKDKELIDRVVDILIPKGIDLFYSVDKNLVTIIDEGNFHLKALEIYNKNPEQRTNFNFLFKEEEGILSNIVNIKRAIYVLLDPKSIIPPHTDDDDHSYRILTGVLTNKKIEFTILNTTIKLKSKKSVGFDASKIEHSSINHDENFCTMLIICLSENPFSSNDLIEIIGTK